VIRNLYRFYLYTVFIALLIFMTVAVGRLLSTGLAFTPLQGSSGSAPSQAEVIQSSVFALITLLIAGALGALHYWLIRRDMRNDPTASSSAIRSFFLNITEAIGVSLAVPVFGFLVLTTLAQSTGANVVASAAFAIATFALVLILELERRRTTLTSGVALTFQRLHCYGVQVLLLVYLTYSWLNAVRPLVDSLLFGGRGAREACSAPNSFCPTSNVPLLLLSVLWFVVFFMSYGLTVRNDNASLLRLILHGAGFAYGVGFILAGLWQALLLLLFFIPFRLPVPFKDIFGPFAGHDVVSPLTLGVLVVILYSWWLRIASKQQLIKPNVLALMEWAIAGVLAEISLWWGVGNLLYNFLQLLDHSSSVPDASSWASCIAFVLVGAGSIGIDLYLHRRHTIEPVVAGSPRRGFVFALLGGGILSFAIGGATALYAWATSLLGTPISDWQQVTHVGLAAWIVGLFLVGIYLWTARREALLSGLGPRPARETPLASSPGDEAVSSVAIGDVLDDLLAGKITRDEAILRLRALIHESNALNLHLR
jgi:hypothetical protein